MPFMWGTAGSDAVGNLYLAAVMTGVAQLGPDSRLSTGPQLTRLFLAKYSPRCQLAWVRWIGEPDEMTRLGSMEVSTEGRIALTRGYLLARAQGSDQRSELLILTRDGEVATAIGSAGGDLFHTTHQHSLAWGTDGSLAVNGLPDLCVTRQGSGACVAKLAANGRLLFGRLIGGAFGAGVALDVQGNLIVAGLSSDAGVVVDGLTLASEPPPYAYVTKFDLAGTPQWLSTTAIDADVPRAHAQGFASVMHDGSLLTAWNDAIRGPVGGGALMHVTRARRLTSKGAQVALHDLKIIGSNGKSEPIFVASPRAELVSAEYWIDDPGKGSGEVSGATQLVWHGHDGASVREVALPERAYVIPSSLRLSPSEQPILVLLEYGKSGVVGAQTALLVRRLSSQ
jgi:hypothetical protein